MDALVLWDALETVTALQYPHVGNGKPPYPLMVMPRVHCCLKLFYSRSDPWKEYDICKLLLWSVAMA